MVKGGKHGAKHGATTSCGHQVNVCWQNLCCGLYVTSPSGSITSGALHCRLTMLMDNGEKGGAI